MRPKRGKVHLDFKTTSVYACWVDQCRKTVDYLLMEPDSDGVRVESSTENFKWQEKRSREGFLSHAEHRKFLEALRPIVKWRLSRKPASPLDDADGVQVWLVSRGRFHKADTRTWMDSMDMADFLQDSLGRVSWAAFRKLPLESAEPTWT